MGLEHEFFLITEDEYKNINCCDRDYLLSKDPSYISVLHDDIIQYIYDTLRWIPCINPVMNNEQGYGIHNWGVTLYDKESAEAIFNISKAWADLFSNGPNILKLTGSFSWTGNNDGQYDILEINKDELVKNFRKLQEFAEKIIASSGKYYILHHGI